MRLIDADALSKSVLEWLPSDPCGRSEVENPFETDICVSMLQEIEEAPTIDAVPMVRCRDCIRTRERDEYTGRLWCSIHRGYMEDTYYCADGLHREDSEV